MVDPTDCFISWLPDFGLCAFLRSFALLRAGATLCRGYVRICSISLVARFVVRETIDPERHTVASKVWPFDKCARMVWVPEAVLHLENVFYMSCQTSLCY